MRPDECSTYLCRTRSDRFEHAVGASGLRMAYEVYNQIFGRAEAQQLALPSIGLTHDLSGVPYQGIAAISILGLY